jgi:hypothetical protein
MADLYHRLEFPAQSGRNSPRAEIGDFAAQGFRGHYRIGDRRIGGNAHHPVLLA